MTSNVVAMVVTLVIWLGLFVFMLSLDKKIKKIESDKS
jgi:CcmD family protein